MCVFICGKIVEKYRKYGEQPFVYWKMLLFSVTIFEISIDFCGRAVYNEAVWCKRVVLWRRMEAKGLIGKYPVKLDDKNRMFVPAKLREELGERFFVTLGTNGGHRCLTIYPAEAWQRLTDNYNALSQAQRAKGPNVIFNNAIECAPDRQFRVALNSFLTRFAGIEREAVVVGCAGQAEIWAAAEYEAYEAENLSPEKLLAALEAIGL